MPAVLAHRLFADRVADRLRENHIEPGEPGLYHIGAQGPDVLYFHRAFPWMPGEGQPLYGLKLHHMSPTRLFEGAARVWKGSRNDREQQYALINGLFCHYALDRAVHPLVLAMQERLQQEQPTYARRSNFYHYRIESALDTLTVRRLLDLPVGAYDLHGALPADDPATEAVFGRFYARLLFVLFQLPPDPGHLGLAVGDMRQALRIMNDPHQLRRLALRVPETLLGLRHIGSSLLRPEDVTDWDYGNDAHAVWENPFDLTKRSDASYAELFDCAVEEAAEMIGRFWQSNGQDDVTQDRGFASNLPGIYEDKE